MSMARVCAVVAIVGASAAHAAGIELVSKGLPGSTPAGGAGGVALTPDGRYLLLEWSSTGVPGIADNNGASDVYRWDRTTGTLALVSHAASQPTVTANNYSRPLAISDDGQYALFTSLATNLIVGGTDTNSAEDVFQWDGATGVVSLVSHSSASATTAGNGVSNAPTRGMAADGSRVVFDSLATNLVAGADANNDRDVFAWARATASVTLISHTSGGLTTTANSRSVADSIRADGAFVVFETYADDILPGIVDGNADFDIYEADATAAGAVLVSHAAGSFSITGNGGSQKGSISADGNYLTFESCATNLVAGGTTTTTTGPCLQVFLNDLFGGTISLVSHRPGAPLAGGNGYSFLWAPNGISADGRYVAFSSLASDLIAGGSDTNFSFDAFLFDRTAASVRLMSHAAGSATTAANNDSFADGFSADGKSASFESTSSNIIAGGTDLNGGLDSFLYDTGTNVVELLSRVSTSMTTAGNGGATERYSPILFSSDGRYVGITSLASDLVAGATDVNGAEDVFLLDRAGGTMALVSQSSGSAAPAGNWSTAQAQMSADGRYIAFSTHATNIDPVQPVAQAQHQVYSWDGNFGTTALVSHLPGQPGTTGFGDSTVDSISADGRFVTFTSTVFHLTVGVDAYNVQKVFVWDRLTDSTRLVSHAVGTPTTAANGLSWHSQTSADGHYVAFETNATDLIAAGGLVAQVYLWDSTTDTMALVTHRSGSTTAGSVGSAQLIAITPDGGWVLFGSSATDLISGGSYPPPLNQQVYLWQRSSGNVTLVSHKAGFAATTPNEISEVGYNNELRNSISADGRYVMYQSGASDLISGGVDANATFDAYLWDRTTDDSTLISHTNASATTSADVGGSPRGLSQDGRFVVFVSASTDLVAGLTGPGGDVYRWDRSTNTSALLSHAPSAPTTRTGGAALSVAMSADGTNVTFSSKATSLIAGGTDTNANVDLFRWDDALDAVSLITHSAGSATTAANPAANGVAGDLSDALSMSADGQYLAFYSSTTDLLAGGIDGSSTQLYRFAPGMLFRSLAPCRLYDSRKGGNMSLTSGVVRLVQAVGLCNIPRGARALSANVTIVSPPTVGYVQAYAGDQSPPPTTTLNFKAGQTRANNAMIQVALGTDGTIALLPAFTGLGTLDVVVDVNGYMQ